MNDMWQYIRADRGTTTSAGFDNWLEAKWKETCHG